MRILIIILAVYFALVLFYLFYIAAVQLYYAWGTLALWVRVVAALPMVCFLVIDLCANIIITLPFFDWPRECLVTQRLKRYRSDDWPAGARKDVATTVCTQALNPFDPTRKHC